MSRGPSRQFDRQEVLARAMEVFWEKGFEGAGLSELLDQMQIGRQSLYNTFGSKEALFLEALRYYLQSHQDRMVNLLRGEGSPRERLEAFVESWQRGIADPDCRGCLLINTCTDLGTLCPEVEQISAEALASLQEIVAEVFSEAIRAGQLSRDHDPARLARILTAAACGLSATSRSTRSQQVLEGALGETLGQIFDQPN